MRGETGKEEIGEEGGGAMRDANAGSVNPGRRPGFQLVFIWRYHVDHVKSKIVPIECHGIKECYNNSYGSLTHPFTVFICGVTEFPVTNFDLPFGSSVEYWRLK